MRDPHQLREEAASAVARGKLDVALALYSELEMLEPTAAAWPKRVGETHRRLGDIPAARGLAVVVLCACGSTSTPHAPPPPRPPADAACYIEFNATVCD